jgi:hypothetical protein
MNLDNKISFELFGITWLEPMTIITDLIISAICFYSFIKLKKINNREPEQIIFNYFFLFMGISFFCGGVIGHGLMYYFGKQGHIPAWFFSMVGVAFFAHAIILRVKSFLGNKYYTLLVLSNWLIFVICLISMLYLMQFEVVETHAIMGILLMGLSLEIWLYYKYKNTTGQFIFLGIFILAMSALVHALKISVDDLWFNQNDLGHLLLAGSMWLFYKGTKKITPVAVYAINKE